MPHPNWATCGLASQIRDKTKKTFIASTAGYVNRLRWPEDPFAFRRFEGAAGVLRRCLGAGLARHRRLARSRLSPARPAPATGPGRTRLRPHKGPLSIG